MGEFTSMRCSRCGHENPPGTKFCGECGEPITLRCPSCGAANPVTQKFCGECGTALTQTAPATRFASPKTYTPKHLAERILISKSVREGERKQVTVLFADLKASMELLADRDPETARRLLDQVLEHMMEAVHHYEGTVNQVMGDGIMAIFGALLAHEDHAVRACYAALRMQQSVSRYAEDIRRTEGVPIYIRVGMNSGEVVVRSISGDLRMDYTAVGRTTHLAARMEQMAMPGSIQLTRETVRLAEGFVDVTPLGPMQVKGLSEPVEVYEVTGARPVRRRLEAAAARGFTPFVGRDAEMDVLRRGLEQARAGHGQVVAVVGEPGVGKSRLLWEFTHSSWAQGCLVLESGSVSYGKATPFLPLIDLIKAYFRIEMRDDARKIREKVTGRLLTLDRAMEPDLPSFLALLDQPVDDARWQALDPSQRRHRIMDACKRLLLRESRVQPLCLVFEDLHWIDTESHVFLDGLVASLPAARVLLLVNYRPEYGHEWASKTYYAQSRLDPLPPKSAEELLISLLGDDVTLRPLMQLLIARTEGNPFFLEETVWDLVETGILVGTRGAYRLARPLAETKVPASVQAILAARIDRLPPEEKTLLQTASVIGKDVPFALLRAIGEQDDESLRRRLAHLQVAEFLYETSIFPDLEYTFKHALTHEVAYGSLLSDRRRAVHARIVEAIESLYSDRIAGQVEHLSHHAYRGEAWEKAVHYLRQAGSKAMSRSGYRDAVRSFEQALAAVGRLPETAERLPQAVDLRVDLRAALFALGYLQKGADHLVEAERVSRSLDDAGRLGWVLLYLSYNIGSLGHPEEARIHSQNALATANTVGDRQLEILATHALGQSWFHSGDFRQANECFRRMYQSLDELGEGHLGIPASPAVLVRTALASVLTELGAFDEGIEHGLEALRIAEAVDKPFSLTRACADLGYLYLVKGKLTDAVTLLERGFAMTSEWNITLLSPTVEAHLGYAYALSGRLTEGTTMLKRAQAAKEPEGSLAAYGLRGVHLGEAHLIAGRRQDAHDAARHALAFTRDRRQRGYEAWALRLLGEIAAQSDRPEIDEAKEYFGQAMALAQELGMRPLLAHCHFGLGKVLQRAERQQEAREHLSAAAALYRDMDMRHWLEQVNVRVAALAS